ncbi:MAG TPA: VOC family protein [Caulobacteraceae bacterium]|nr:VOC family protein [Caulobacteraceae bacterium]
MAAVVGLGGVFYKAADKGAVRDWYDRVLGVKFTDWGGAMFEHPKAGCTQVTPFAADTDHFKPSTQPFMINLIVDDLDGLLARAEAAGAAPLGREEHEGFGKFAWLLDPDGIKIELWQPAD